MRVLICDDAAMKVMSIRKYLEVLGITDIQWVEYEKDVFREIQNSRYDLLLLDMTLPTGKNSEIINLGGKHILYELCNREIDIPTIVITHYADFSPDARWNTKSVNWSVERYINRNFLDPEIDFLAEMGNEDIYFIENLHRFLCEHYSIYAGLIYMDEEKNDWKPGLKTLIDYIAQMTRSASY